MRSSSICVKGRFLLLVVLAAGLQSCDRNDNPVGPAQAERGQIVRVAGGAGFSASSIQQILASGNVTVPFALTYDVESISIEYNTVDGNGNIALVSGALLVPQGAGSLPLASIQHGTQTKRDLVASVSPLNSVEGIAGLAIASLGYAVVIPDYLGFGVSRVMHPYLHARSLVPGVVDLVRAARSYCARNLVSLNGKLFLTGYSEGGYVTLVTQKAMEEEYGAEFTLTAVAPLAGPYDLAGMTDTVFRTGTYGTPAYIALFLTAYDGVYGWNRLQDFFNPPYAAMMPGLFDGSKTWGEVVNQLPTTFSALMNPSFVANYLGGHEQALQSALQENTLLNWRPRAPIHFFHGDADDVVPIQNAYTAMNAFIANGAVSVQLTTIPGGTHETSGPYAIVGAVQWFETM